MWLKELENSISHSSLFVHAFTRGEHTSFLLCKLHFVFSEYQRTDDSSNRLPPFLQSYHVFVLSLKTLLYMYLQ